LFDAVPVFLSIGMASDADISRLLEAANAAKANAYCPYSNFPVGAAILCKDGSVFGGCNVENCAYPSGICAERSAISVAVSAGHRDFAAILVCSKIGDAFITPCGFCRQVIAEFGNLEIILTKGNGEIKRMKLTELLPLAFSPADLTK
jgi:cytidine deaminase